MKTFLQYLSYVFISAFIVFVGVAILSQIVPSQQDLLPTAIMVIKGLK